MSSLLINYNVKDQLTVDTYDNLNNDEKMEDIGG